MSDPRTTSSVFARGAVDLGALRAQSQSSPSAEASPDSVGARPGGAAPSGVAAGGGVAGRGPAGPGVAVIDVTEATFHSEVLQRSMTTPVLVDFWADWCQPCKQLSPVLERLAVEGGGAWVLAKVNVDANPRLAQMFRVQSIPMVYAIVGGQPIDGFTGVIPEAQLRQWIEAVLRTAGVAVQPPQDPRMREAEEAVLRGDLDAAEQAYKKILAESPADTVAESGLARVELLRRVRGVDQAAALAAADSNPDDIPAQLLAADIQVLQGQAEQAYERLIDLVRRTAGDDRETVRKHLISLFTIAGPDDPAVSAARRALASALF
ncbi:MAG TPA: tetratricopeptide repeat protein [Micromonospora sp.]